MEQDKYADALEQYKKLVELEPGTSENHLRLAQLYRRLGQFDKAQSSLDRAKQLAPGSLEILFNEALLDEDQGHYDDAVKLLTDAIAGIKSQGAGGNSNALAILYEQLGRAYRGAKKLRGCPRSICGNGKLGGAIPRSGLAALAIETYRENHNIDQAHR